MTPSKLPNLTSLPKEVAPTICGAGFMGAVNVVRPAARM